MTPELATTEARAPKWDVVLVKAVSRFMPDEAEQNAFVGALLAAFSKNPKIGECSTESIMACVRDCALLDLAPNTPLGLAYLIPRSVKVGDEWILTLGLEIGYKGYAHLLYRDGAAKKIQAGVVHAGDFFEHQLGTGGFIRHRRSFEPGRKDKPIICAWVEFTLSDGSIAVEIMDADDLAAVHAAMMRQNKEKETPAWKFFGDEMRKKACLKRGVKLLPRCHLVDTAIAIEHAQPMALATPAAQLPDLSFGDKPKALPDRAAEEPPCDEPAEQDDSAMGRGWDEEKQEFIF